MTARLIRNGCVHDMRFKHIRKCFKHLGRPGLCGLVGLLVAILCTGCAGTGYLGNRLRDGSDVFTATVGMGGGAKARVGPIQAGALVNVDMWGLRGGDFGDVTWYETFTRDGLFPVPADWVGNPMAGSGLFGEERFAYEWRRGVTRQRGKDFLAKAPLPVLGLSKQPEYYTQIEVVLGILGTVRLGLNAGELVDFILGWTTLDIYRDDWKTAVAPNET